MKNKNFFFLTIILLLVSVLTTAQTVNPYADFAPEELKKNKDYARNFNPGNYNTKILYNCMIDMLNAARKQYSFTAPFKHDIKLDSTAQMQADYQAVKNEKTELNNAPYKTLNFRLKKYGLSQQGVELVTKAKAHMGTSEYSYYDLCLELIRPVLKNLKTAKVLLDKQYTYVGFGFETDEFMRTMYASYILGNDYIFLPFKPLPGDKTLPYTKGKAGMNSFDERICRKCSDDISLEALSGYISRKGDDIILSCDDHKTLRRMIGKEGDAIVLDFVQHSQYECGKTNMVDHDLNHRGFVTKPIVFAKILEANEMTDKKSTRLTAKIATVPQEIDSDADFDMNIIVLKEGKYACRTVMKKNIEIKNADYEEKVNFLKDETTVKSAGDWVISPEDAVIEFSIPFTSQKLDYKFSDFDTVFSRLDRPAHKINKVEIVAHNSLNYAGDATQSKNQKRRAESIAKAFTSAYPGIQTEIRYDDSWEEFKKDIVYSEEYYDLALGTKEEAIKKLKENNGRTAKAVEEYLVKHRFARIVLHITYQTDGVKEQEYAVFKFNQALENKNLPLAMSIQRYIIKQVEDKEYTSSAASQMVIPENKAHQPFLINKLYLQYLAVPKMTDKIASDMKKVYALDNTNQIAGFNINVAELYTYSFSEIADITKMQTAVDRLYTLPQLPKEKVNSLNLEWQFKIIDYLTSRPSTLETANLLTATYTKIKTIRNPKLDSWQNAYKLASYFVKNNDYLFALELMDPFLEDGSITEDFLFSYVSIGAHRPETYMSGLFTQSVGMASLKNVQRLCAMFDKLPISVFDNLDVKQTVCKTCNR